jgi:hypothetical protein
MTNSRYNAHTTPLFASHKVLTFEKILKMGKLKFMHSVYYNYAPKSFSSVWTKNNERNLNQNLRDGELFTLPIPRIDFFKKLPIYSLPFEWNNSGNLRFYTNQITFYHALRDQLFTELEENQ